ncbi:MULTISPECIES: mandelate racemase/muconate lactonizing enzyme family protein [Microbacterium]|uniref:Mandelate racemase n=1 Tax=Microbacterium trichothecenolyticum TaxID=69370 RepID=A0A0M2HDB0_MICTR|nr:MULTISPECIES: mandelate racemase/muconate lactonizing enzyme family protein [Microbacterium]KJL44571.1 Mandelate racemase [Microbacterium trichothecenolyticum]MDR7187490.1 L-alanine-DL-glutamate epimerase-like enolase superfamily enzyme [Microbacterium sp. BE35]
MTPAPASAGPPRTTIASFDARLVRVPLTRPWAADVTSVGVVATHVVRSDGAEGWGFSWTPQIGAEAVHALLAHDIAAWAIGRSAEPGEEWLPLWQHLHEAGGGGITTIAMAGLDLALWDAAARADDRSVVQWLGPQRESVRAYGSGVNLHYSLDELVAQVRRWVDSGFDAVKVKVGKPDVAEDLDRMQAVRDVLGPDRQLMIDANQRWDLDRATSSLEVLAAVSPAWIEEPLRADDLYGHYELSKRLSASSAIPIAVGENLHNVYRFDDFLRTGAAQIVQPNIVRVGGITPFLGIAAIAGVYGAAVHPHLLPELSGQLALCLRSVPGVPEPMAEDVEDAGFGALGALRDPSPVRIADGTLTEVPHVGLGLRFS